MSKDFTVMEVGGKEFAVKPSTSVAYSTMQAAIDTLYFIGEIAGYGAVLEYSPEFGWAIWMRSAAADEAECLTEGHEDMVSAVAAAWEAFQEEYPMAEKP